MYKRLSTTRVRVWLAILGVSTLLLGVSYGMVQQSTRLAVDDQPLAAAQAAEHQLAVGAEPSDVVPAVKSNLKQDSIVFVIITDAQQHVLASSAVLNNKTPLPPIGVFNYTKQHGTDHFTWEPENGVRIATRVITYSSSGTTGFIISGQSLKQAEERIDIYTALAFAAWIAIVAWASLALLLPAPRNLNTKTAKKK